MLVHGEGGSGNVCQYNIAVNRFSFGERTKLTPLIYRLELSIVASHQLRASMMTCFPKQHDAVNTACIVITVLWLNVPLRCATAIDIAMGILFVAVTSLCTPAFLMETRDFRAAVHQVSLNENDWDTHVSFTVMSLVASPDRKYLLGATDKSRCEWGHAELEKDQAFRLPRRNGSG